MFQNLIKNYLLTAMTASLTFAFPGPLLSEIPQSTLNEMAPMHVIYHPVSTKNPEAQKSFNRGLTYIFAYNHDIAFKEFEKASLQDPNLAMAYWGMALALGQNINSDVTAENEIKAYEYSQKALSLLSNATPVEEAYIKALVQRYTNDPSQDLVKLRFVYRDAMKKVSNDYPEDLDAACLYAESILDLDPWRYWTWDGKPKEGTYEAIDVLESVLNRNPEHIGANHYYIHAWEESPWPERALLSAYRLTQLLPESGHLLHMPCHIFILCGYYPEAIDTNTKAIAEDRKYIQENGMGGPYPLHYLSHNMKILVRAYMLSENYEKAMIASNELFRFIEPYYQGMPHLAGYLIVPMEVNLYFHRWKEILSIDAPRTDNAMVHSFWHYSRAQAYANLGDMQGFQKERGLAQDYKQKINSDEVIANNPGSEVLDLGMILLDASQARLQNNYPAHIEYLQKAIDVQDRFYYDEPPAWFVPLRIKLGKALLEEKRYKEAEEVFRKGLSGLKRMADSFLALI